MAKRLLFIDDNEDLLEMLQIVFQDSEFDLVLKNRLISQDEIESLRPDIIFLDVHVGEDKTGDMLCLEIKTNQRLKHTPTFLLSSEYNLGFIAEQCMADGAIPKPFDIISLKKLIKKKLTV